MELEQLKSMSIQEINKLCAIKIMGFNYRGYLEERPEYPYVSPNPQGKLVLYETDNDGYWNPAEDLKAAFMLVNKLDDRLFSIYANPIKSREKRFTIHVSKHAMGMNNSDISLDNLPLAICYSALLATSN